jgi:hypothetical protein
MPHSPSYYLFFAAIFGLAIFRRIVKPREFLKFTPGGHIFSMVLFSLLALMMMWFALMSPLAFLYYACGTALGLVLYYFASKHTIFENRDGVVFFRANVWTELIVLLLFSARLIYRFVVLDNRPRYSAINDPHSAANIFIDPFMSIGIFLLCSYYIAYKIFLFRKVSEVKKQVPTEQFYQQ